MRTVNLWKRLQWRRRGVRIHVAPGAQLVLGDAVTVGRGTRLTVNAGTLRIGEGAHIGERCSIVVQERVDLAANLTAGAVVRPRTRVAPHEVR
jgi:carbonic anhydrase/acetyltransferase-like protein (isoleucine patch superfamily)